MLVESMNNQSWELVALSARTDNVKANVGIILQSTE